MNRIESGMVGGLRYPCKYNVYVDNVKLMVWKRPVMKIIGDSQQVGW